MVPVVTTAAIVVLLLAAILVGTRLRAHLPENHLSADSKDAVKVAMGLVATMTALLLGLLVSSAKATYDAERNQIIAMAAKVAFLDRVLVLYGADAADARLRLREGVTEAVHDMWPEDRNASAQLRPDQRVGNALYVTIQRLAPRDDSQRDLKAHASAIAADLAGLRMQLVAQAVPSIPMTLLVVVVFWLALTFLGFSLLTPPNATTMVALFAAATSVAGAIFLMLELDEPFSGLLRVSGAPMVEVLRHLVQ
jgi:hypothetical protein